MRLSLESGRKMRSKKKKKEYLIDILFCDSCKKFFIFVPDLIYIFYDEVNDRVDFNLCYDCSRKVNIHYGYILEV